MFPSKPGFVPDYDGLDSGGKFSNETLKYTDRKKEEKRRDNLNVKKFSFIQMLFSSFYSIFFFFAFRFGSIAYVSFIIHD